MPANTVPLGQSRIIKTIYKQVRGSESLDRERASEEHFQQLKRSLQQRQTPSLSLYVNNVTQLLGERIEFLTITR